VCRSDAAAWERVAVSRYSDDACVFSFGVASASWKNWAEGEQQLLAACSHRLTAIRSGEICGRMRSTQISARDH